MAKRCSHCKADIGGEPIRILGRLETVTGYEICSLIYYVCSPECQKGLELSHKSEKQQKAEDDQLRCSFASILADMKST